MRSHFLHTVLGLTALGGALVACGDDSSGSGGGGGASSGTEATTTVTSATVGPATVAQSTGQGVGPTTTTVGPGPTTSTGGDCAAGDVFADPETNDCGLTNCCDEMTVCAGDFTLCFDQATGALDETLADGAALAECMQTSGCFGSAVCDSGLAFSGSDAADYAACLGDNCCEEFNFCTSNGVDVQGCIDCLNGDQANYDLCESANACALTNCDQGVIFVNICDSGLGVSDPNTGTCLSDNCCEEFTACTGDQSDAAIQACIDCFNAGGGAECDAAITCEDTNCSTAICDSGLTIGDIDLAACLTTSCCDEFTACTGDQSDAAVQACIDCFNAGSGAECDAAIACEDANCGGGGTGGGGAGGGGVGGGI